MSRRPNERLGNTNTMVRNNEETIRGRRALLGIVDDVQINEGRYSSVNIYQPHTFELNPISYWGEPPKIRKGYIKMWNYVPDKFNFNKLENEEIDLFMGVELDCGGETEEKAKFIQEFLGENNCYIMHDGSLDNGLEITTHPCSLNYHKSLNYKELFKRLTEEGYKSHNTKTCGLHVHVNRNYFGNNVTIQDLCITKILFLLEKHWNDVKVIARRDSTKYAQRFYYKEEEGMFSLLAKAKGYTNDYFNTAKYQIVNLLHKDTIEFRLFKGTLKYETFIATLEFVSNITKLCKEVSLEQIQSVNFDDIINFEETQYLESYYKQRLNK